MLRRPEQLDRGPYGSAPSSKPQPLNRELFFWKLSSRLPYRSVLAVITGMSTTFFARAVKVCADMKVAISGMLGTISLAFCSGR